MYITVTSIRLRRLWSFFRLSLYALHILKQLKTEKGLLAFRKRGLGLLHYTITAWETETDLKRFAHSGAHLEAMKHMAQIATEVRTHTFEAEAIPNWQEAREGLFASGKVYRTQGDAPRH